nr:iron ABC transporter permease [Planctomycetota bacterium]
MTALALRAPAARGARRARHTLLGWLAAGAVGFVLLPWYFPQNVTLLQALPGIFGGGETASGLVQAIAHGRPWLWVAALAL